MDAERSPASAICFGLDRETDQRSLALFLQRFTDDELLRTLIPRMNQQEIERVVVLLTAIMRNHFSEQEYHHLFLGETGHGHH